MSDIIYNEAKYRIWTQTLHLVDDPVKVMLVSPDYTPDPDHAYIDDGTILSPINFELDGVGYESGFGGTGRRALQNKSFAKDLATDRIRYYADNVIWNPINIGVETPAGAAILILEGTSDADSLLIAYILSGGFPKVTDGGELLLRFSDNGVLTLA
jgi:hypothetical protein